nr:MAG TPA: hypothetical protein [Caudoviricetes sp.]
MYSEVCLSFFHVYTVTCNKSDNYTKTQGKV